MNVITVSAVPGAEAIQRLSDRCEAKQREVCRLAQAIGGASFSVETALSLLRSGRGVDEIEECLVRAYSTLVQAGR